MKTTLLLFLGFSVRLLAIDFAVPARTGDVAAVVPFAENSARFQQVYGASAFSSLTPVGGGWITAIQFAYKGGSFFQQPAYQINFSTTQQPVDGLSSLFAANVGTDDQIAVSVAYSARTPFTQTGGGPLGIGILIPLETPFFYNPTTGNLLMDVRMHIAAGSLVDASTLPTDQTSSTYAFNRDNLTGATDTFGLITGFRINPVPEPSPTALLIGALAIASLFGLRKKQRHRKE